MVLAGTSIKAVTAVKNLIYTGVCCLDDDEDELILPEILETLCIFGIEVSSSSFIFTTEPEDDGQNGSNNPPSDNQEVGAVQGAAPIEWSKVKLEREQHSKCPRPLEVKGEVKAEKNGNICEKDSVVKDLNMGNTFKEINCGEIREDGSKSVAKRRKSFYWFNGVQCAVEGCGKMLYSRGTMEDHMRKTHGAEKLSCPRPNCEAKYSSSWGLKLHLRGHDKGVEKFFCPRTNCGMFFISSWGLKVHLRGHDEKVKLFCPRPDCKAILTSSWGLKLHLCKHDKEDKVIRIVKTKKMKKQESLEIVEQQKEADALKQKSIGLKSHKGKKAADKRSPESELKFNDRKKRADKKCEVEGCLRMFPPGCDYKRGDHMRMEHGQSKLFCQQCEASYFSKDGLNRHVKKVHKGGNGSIKEEIVKVEDVKVEETDFEVLDMEIF